MTRIYMVVIISTPVPFSSSAFTLLPSNQRFSNLFHGLA